PAHFRFNVLSYTCAVSRWQPTLQPADPGAKASAISWLQAILPDSQTGTGPAVADALSDRRNLCVVLVSDGGASCGAAGRPGHLAMIGSANTQNAQIYTVGFILSPFADKRFLRQVARDSGARYVPVR